MTPVFGDSLKVREFPKSETCTVLGIYIPFSNGTNLLQLTSQTFHDSTAIQIIPSASLGVFDTPNILPEGVTLRLQSGDTLRIQDLGKTFEGNFAILSYFSDLPGKSTRYIDYGTLMRRGKTWKTVIVDAIPSQTTHYVPCVLTGTAKQTIDDGTFHADSDYAVIGASFQNNFANGDLLLRLRGEETGGFNIPLVPNAFLTDSLGMYPKLAKRYGLPVIPILRGLNIAQVALEAVGEFGNATGLQIDLMELNP